MSPQSCQKSPDSCLLKVSARLGFVLDCLDPWIVEGLPVDDSLRLDA